MLKLCKKKDRCSCLTEEGTITLKDLAGKDGPRFSSIHCTEFSSCTLSWNPCNSYSAAAASRKCHNVAACARFGNVHSSYHPIAYQSTATCELSYNGYCALKYTGEEMPLGYSTSLTVALICVKELEGTVKGMRTVITNSSFDFAIALRSKYACPIANSKAGLDSGIKLLIAICCVLFASVILGLFLYKKIRGRRICHLPIKQGMQCTDKSGYTSV